MLLLTVEEWLCPKRQGTKPTVKTKAFATDLGLEAAIALLSGYEDAYNRHFTSMSLNFTLLAVSTIESISDGALDVMGVELIEKLKTSFD